VVAYGGHHAGVLPDRRQGGATVLQAFPVEGPPGQLVGMALSGTARLSAALGHQVTEDGDGQPRLGGVEHTRYGHEAVVVECLVGVDLMVPLVVPGPCHVGRDRRLS